MTGPRQGVRIPWADAPTEFAARLAAHLGAPIVHAADLPGGFSPGAAASLTFGDGRRMFVKVVRDEPNPTSLTIYRMEAAALALLDGSGLAPRLLWQAEGAEPSGAHWFGMAIEHVEGRHPHAPWRPDELTVVLGAIARLGAVPAAQVGALPDSIPRLARLYGFWQAESSRSPDDRRSGAWPIADDAVWIAENLPALSRAEAGWPDAARGDRLVHGDLRSDNLLLHDTQVTFLDWPYVGFGAGWLDLVLMLPSMVVEGGVDPEAIIRSHPLTASVPDADIDAVLAATTGYFVRQSLQPDPPGLPTLRGFQRAQGAAAIDWLTRRWS